MIFEVSRAQTMGENSPCKGAKKVKFERRDGEADCYWTIKICTLKELIQFFEKHGSLIIQGGFSSDKVPVEIKIYDDYVE